MNENILTTTKKMLGLSSTDSSFNDDILVCINSSVANLSQLGVAIEEGIEVTSNTTYNNITTNTVLISMIKPFIYIQTRLLFDPPSSSSVMESLKSQLKELEWRLYTWRDYSNGR